jgi:hypothetical protein
MKVYLWDRDSSLTTVSDVIDFGEGFDLKIGVVDGFLVGLIVKTPNSMISVNTGAIIAKVMTNKIATTVFQRKETSGLAIGSYIVKENKFYFVCNADINDHNTESTYGVWCLSRKPDGTWNMSVDQVMDNVGASVITAAGSFADFWFLVNSTGTIVKTNDTLGGSYLFSSVYESQIYNGSIYGYDSTFTKKLIGVSVTHEKLPTDGQAVLAYRADGAVAWTTIFTNTTNDSLSHEAINIESSGANLPQYKEIEFRIESTGGAVITGFSFKEEFIDKRLY